MILEYCRDHPESIPTFADILSGTIVDSYGIRADGYIYVWDDDDITDCIEYEERATGLLIPENLL